MKLLPALIGIAGAAGFVLLPGSWHDKLIGCGLAIAIVGITVSIVYVAANVVHGRNPITGEWYR